METQDEALKHFLEKNRITNDVWEKANIEWTVLQEIAADHELHVEHLKKSAELFATLIQKSETVHSVRWRVKATDHVLTKIIRKRSEGNEKYANITLSNYFECITDLVGIRALHLFKEECFEIDRYLKSLWVAIETPIAYMRNGDRDELKDQFKEYGFDVKDHPAGYRSVHYVLQSTPINRKVIAELQVRTIFEEGWSEIDHRIRYPNFSDNEQVEYFLTILNRMAGSADEMGSFVKGLTSTLSELAQQVAVAQIEKEKSVRAMEDALNQLSQMNQQGRTYEENIEKLKAEVVKLKADAEISGAHGKNLRSTTNSLHRIALGISPELFKTIGKDAWTGISPEVLKNINANALMGVSPELLNTISGNALTGIPPEVLNTIAGNALQGISPTISRSIQNGIDGTTISGTSLDVTNENKK